MYFCYFEFKIFKRRTADFLYFLFVSIPIVSLLQLYYGHKDAHNEYNVFLAYIASKFDDEIVIAGLMQLQPKLLMVLFFLNYVFLGGPDLYSLSALVLLSHVFNFVKFIVPNQVSTTGIDVLKTPGVLNKAVLWAYGTSEDEELFD